MIRTLTREEITAAYGWPTSKIYRLASVDEWRKVGDKRRPVLYNADDVEKTAERLRHAANAPA